MYVTISVVSVCITGFQSYSPKISISVPLLQSLVPLLWSLVTLSRISGALKSTDKWDNPEAIVAIIKMVPYLPLLKDLLVAFLNGGLET